MTQIPVICPKCKSWTYPVVKKSLGSMIRKLFGRTLYECEDCGWQGYVVFKEERALVLWVIIAIVVFVLFIMAVAK